MENQLEISPPSPSAEGKSAGSHGCSVPSPDATLGYGDGAARRPYHSMGEKEHGAHGVTRPTLELSKTRALVYVIGAGVCFNLAYSVSMCSFLVAGYLWCLFELTRAKTSRQAFYFGLLAGALAFGPQTDFLWNIFGAAAIALLYVLAFWIALFVMLGRLARVHLGKVGGLVVIPFLWTGLEYFRSELYYLRFSWLNAGYVFSNHPQNVLLGVLGMYGIGFVGMALFAGVEVFSKGLRDEEGNIEHRTSNSEHRVGERLAGRLALPAIMIGLLIVGLAIATNLPNVKDSPSIVGGTGGIRVAGVQLEAPTDTQVIESLDKLVVAHPEAELLVLSEYTFMGPLPERVKDWCRAHQRYLVVGAEEPAGNANYYDTAFVVGPTGEIVFKQAKSVPIQFFKDGLPAKEQKLWESPWGKIGFCVCYDLSYTRVTDRLIELGAQALIVPTMDVVDWGRHQHELHARVAPVRAAEYGVPIFRMASSGISQLVDAGGRVVASAPMPGDGAMIFGALRMEARGRMPVDRYLAPVAVGITGLVVVWMICKRFGKKKNLTTDKHG